MDPLPVDTLVIAADDRTGALEVAGSCAVAGAGTVRVVPLGQPLSRATGGAVVVVDLDSRHLRPSDAAAVAAALDEPASGRGADSAFAMHKIDSTLRGNWAHELVARRRRRGGSMLVVPALPALGRCCVGGEVREHGRPVAQMTGAIDVRGPVASSRPADAVRGAGAAEVAEVAPGASLDAWLRAGPSGPDFAVCDASSAADLTAIARAWAPHATRVGFAGTSASIAAGVAALGLIASVPARDPAEASDRGVAPGMALPWLVVAGSVHPATAAQLAALVSLASPGSPGSASVVLQPGAPDHLVTNAVDHAVRRCSTGGVVVLRCERPMSPVVHGAAESAAATLARAASYALRQPFATLVVLGGDTAAAVIAGRAVDVGGTVAPGVPWGRLVQHEPSGRTGDLLVVTKAGAFGDPDLLVRLLPERNLR